MIVSRLKQYEADTEPLVEDFRDRGVLRRIDALQGAVVGIPCTTTSLGDVQMVAG